jgi:hypothetical protein
MNLNPREQFEMCEGPDKESIRCSEVASEALGISGNLIRIGFLLIARKSFYFSKKTISDRRSILVGVS